MKRILIAFLLVLNIGIAYSADKTITSKTYVDNQLATKQDTIPAVDTNTVITHTGTNGEISQKAIYDSGENYVSQQTALMTAGDANTGINTALENEFICIDWDTDGTCLIWKIRNQTEHPSSKNLLDDSFMDNSSYVQMTVNGRLYNNAKILPTEAGKTYTLSATLTGTGGYYYYLSGLKPDGTQVLSMGSTPSGPCGYFLWNTNDEPQFAHAERNVWCYFTAQPNVVYVVFFVAGIENLSISNYQMEEGSSATEYEPYKNLYIPQNQ